MFPIKFNVSICFFQKKKKKKKRKERKKIKRNTKIPQTRATSKNVGKILKTVEVRKKLIPLFYFKKFFFSFL